ncbi:MULTISPECIES: glycosyltransferase family 2 protein [Lactobacillaceae]|uniref:glycosyltransferase family 2 protein n=1 Tax=Lactobacillaceae TaxID=33958 RepID=UPI00112274C9|nr:MULTISPECIES: glycosyltransferase family 2 protein [Lactobacillaceae]MDB7773114.1 glycosyltransferase family 2 protein [Lactiplantibacillus plantarum]TOY83811.1 hypothetical protein DIS15_12840 [Levilactobacillus brevis]
MYRDKKLAEIYETSPLFSIIVPVYNVEDYLGKCIDSVMQQSVSNFELLLIDNESTDSSRDICMHWAKSDARIKVFSQKKKGPAATKNTGLQHATGTYVVFVDSDDYIVPNLLKIVLSTIEENNAPDVIYFNYSTLQHDELRENNLILNPGGLSTSQAYRSQFMVGGYGGFAWNKVFKRDQIREKQFNEDLFYLEDSVFVSEVVNSNPSIVAIRDSLYVYRQRKASITHVRFSTQKLTYVKGMDILVNTVPKEYATILIPEKKFAEIDFAAKVFLQKYSLYKSLKRSFDNDLIVNENRTMLRPFPKFILKVSDYSFGLAVSFFALHDIVKQFFKMLHLNEKSQGQS